MDSTIILFRGAGQDPLPTLKRLLSKGTEIRSPGEKILILSRPIPKATDLDPL